MSMMKGLTWLRVTNWSEVVFWNSYFLKTIPTRQEIESDKAVSLYDIAKHYNSS